MDLMRNGESHRKGNLIRFLTDCNNDNEETCYRLWSFNRSGLGHEYGKSVAMKERDKNINRKEL